MHIYWIGARQTDVLARDFFVGTVTRYGDNSNNNFAFNKNHFTKDYNKFLSDTLSDILKYDPDAKFMFANGQQAYSLGKEIFDNTICLNSISSIDALNNKIFMRNYLGRYIKTPISIVISKNAAQDYAFVKSIFHNDYTTFVVQDAISAGGNKSSMYNEEFSFISDDYSNYVLITPYISNSVTINEHIILSEGDYRLFQPSIQITTDNFSYSGSDFIKYKELDNSEQNAIIEMGKQIASNLVKLGVRGLLGVDYILKENQVYFLECNFRYQGSTCLLNMALIEQGFPSIFELIYESFHRSLKNLPNDSYNIPISYSCFRRTTTNNIIRLPMPYMINDVNKMDFASIDGYLQYEIYRESVIDLVERQLIQNLCLFD